MYRIYGDLKFQAEKTGCIITEDSNAGYDFFSSITSDSVVKCVSAKGAGNIFRLLQQTDDEQITVIADGAAFGSQMGRIYHLMQRRTGICLYLPDSFEWLILSSVLIDDSEVWSILEKPYDYIDSRTFFSWERFFTAVLTDKSKGTWLQYSKSKLNPVYLEGKCLKKILEVMPDAIRKSFLKD